MQTRIQNAIISTLTEITKKLIRIWLPYWHIYAQRSYIPQSRPSTRRFLQSSHYLTWRRVCVYPSPPPLWFRGEDPLFAGRERGGVPIRTRDKHCETLGIYVLCDIQYRGPQCLSPRPNWDLPPPLPQVSVALLPEPKGGWVRGMGGPNWDDWRESLALCLIGAMCI
jgi:hypothetical protein